MKLKTSELDAYFTKPKTDALGVLIFGSDAMRVALKRQQVIKALIGPNGAEEMRLTRIQASALRAEPALLMDAIKAIGFFPGPRVAFVEDASETQARYILPALEAWEPGDAQIIVSAGALKPTSKLRKAFEAHPSAYAAAIYDTPPSRAEIERMLQDKALRIEDQGPRAALEELALTLDPGDFQQTLEKLALYKLNDSKPVDLADIAACAPMSVDAEIDDILLLVGDGRADQIGPMMRRLQDQGVTAVALCIGLMRHFTALYRAASDTSGRPALWGPNRDKMLAQSRRWGAERLEAALAVITDTDLALRSAGQTAPAMALVERSLIRLAMLGAR